jgi:predicted ArsR family transcriptional regulator
MDNSKVYENARTRLSRIYQTNKKGQIKDMTRAGNLCNALINDVRNCHGEKAVRELSRELKSRKLM